MKHERKLYPFTKDMTPSNAVTVGRLITRVKEVVKERNEHDADSKIASSLIVIAVRALNPG
jgi:predicted DNA-binding ribbon-helix-helix protein